MKLYTRSGDDGTTGLFGGERVMKDHPRVEAYGTVDELNAAIGLALATPQPPPPPPPPPTATPGQSAAPARVAADSNSFPELLHGILTALQSRLFDLGADLATPESPAGARHESKITRINADHVKEAEQWIDAMDAGNRPLQRFVLPGGSELAARLHLARTVCRRAERAIVRLGQIEGETVNPQVVIYMNRVSDLLFAMARRANREAGVADVEWAPHA